MKAFLSGFILVILSALLFVSCQKEVDSNILNTPQSDSTDLSRIVVLDTTLVTGQDTLFKISFIYDNQKRRTGEDYTEIDNMTGIRYTTYYRYSYSGSDTLPFSATEKYNFSTDSLVSRLYYSNGFIVKDSSVYFMAGTVIDINTMYFSSLGGSRYLRRNIFTDPATGMSGTIDSVIYSRTVNGGNLISGVDSVWIPSGPPSLFRAESFQFSYDNKVNPLAKLTLWYFGYHENFDEQIFIDKGANNLLSSRTDELFPSSSTEVFNYAYSYNSKGYPSIIRTNGTDGNKALYFYTKL